MTVLELAIEEIKEAPLRKSRLEYYYGDLEVRRILLDDFPYAAIFVILPTELVLVAVAHTSREPLYWIDRLKDL